MRYTLRIQEISQYYQYGTVYVEADSLEEAIRKVEQGEEGTDYSHEGDNQIDFESEQLSERTVIFHRDLVDLKLDINNENVSIYFDNKEEEPTYICYWNRDEWIEDSDYAVSIAHAIDLYHRDPVKLLTLLGYERYLVDPPEAD